MEAERELLLFRRAPEALTHRRFDYRRTHNVCANAARNSVAMIPPGETALNGRQSVCVGEVCVKRLCGPQGGWIIAPDELARHSDLQCEGGGVAGTGGD